MLYFIDTSAFSIIWHFTLITGFLCRSTRLFGLLFSLTLTVSFTLGLCHILLLLLPIPLSQVFQGSRLFSYYGLPMSNASSPGLAPPAPSLMVCHAFMPLTRQSVIFCQIIKFQLLYHTF